ncbi:MAG: hypothetical protein IMZ59_01140 [Actinobacteria bacterium]|nr:hypothetical protein [Actinomycetota bacterium]
MRIVDRIIEINNTVVENYCCNSMKYQIDVGAVKFSSTGFFIFGTYGISYCPFCGKKIDYE